MLIEGHSRGCNPEGCIRFKERADGYIDPNLLAIEKLYYSGYSDRSIAKELGITRYTVYTWRTAQGLEPKGEALRGRPKKE